MHDTPSDASIRTGVYRLASLFSRRRRRFAAGARREATRASRGTDARRAARQRRGLHCVKRALTRTSHGVAARNAGTRAAYHPTILADLYPHSVPSSQVRAPVRAPFAVKAEAVRTHPATRRRTPSSRARQSVAVKRRAFGDDATSRPRRAASFRLHLRAIPRCIFHGRLTFFFSTSPLRSSLRPPWRRRRFASG